MPLAPSSRLARSAHGFAPSSSNVQGGAELLARVDAPTGTAKALAVQKLCAGALERGRGVCVADLQRLPEVVVEVLVLPDVGSNWGLGASSNSRVSVRDSIATGNASIGFNAYGATAIVGLENCLAADNLYGINSLGIMRVAGTTVTENTYGVVGTTVEGNGIDGTFTALFAAK